MCCSTACATQEQDSGEEPRHEACSNPLLKAALGKVLRDTPQILPAQKRLWSKGPDIPYKPPGFSLSKPIWLKKRTIPIHASLKTLTQCPK